MALRLRPALPADRTAIAAFTQDTFTWGDYVAGAFDEWLVASNALVLVAADGDVPVAMARGVLLSPTELWLHGARVHPDWRGQGIAGRLNEALVDWGRERGARVVRLLIEAWNEAAQRQVTRNGYRPVSEWIYARREFSPGDPNPTRNGGKRVPGPERLHAASGSEAEPAFLAWSASPLMRQARGLFGLEWKWRLLSIHDLVAGAKARTFFECPSGWVLMSRTGEGVLEVAWTMATPDDLSRLVRAVLDHALATDASALQFQLPAMAETTAAVERIGCEMRSSAVWERAVDVRTG